MSRFAYAALLLLFVGTRVLAEQQSAAGGAGRGGPYFEFHTANLNAFDSAIAGFPIVLGGEGFGYASKSFRLGGGGGGGFIWTPSSNVSFGMGFGGVVGEYAITSWLNARLMIGGGGYAVAKTVAESDTTKTEQKISSGAFLLFHPSLGAEIMVQSWMRLGLRMGYFLPNVSRLQSFTLGVHLIFGKV